MTAQLPRSNDPQRAKLTARDFWTLADAGAFEGFARTELIEGEVWVVNSVWAWHAGTAAHIITELATALRALSTDLIVYTSGSVDLTDDSVPQLDVSIGKDHDGRGLPLDKLRLAVEVSDATRTNDLIGKAALYARAGVFRNIGSSTSRSSASSACGRRRREATRNATRAASPRRSSRRRSPT